MLIENLSINGHELINVPADTKTLVELGMPFEEAKTLVHEHDKQARLNLALENRKFAYVSQSDPLFMEAIRKDASGDTEGAEAARVQALKAVADIKAKYPLPENA